MEENMEDVQILIDVAIKIATEPFLIPLWIATFVAVFRDIHLHGA